MSSIANCKAGRGLFGLLAHFPSHFFQRLQRPASRSAWQDDKPEFERDHTSRVDQSVAMLADQVADAARDIHEFAVTRRVPDVLDGLRDPPEEENIGLSSHPEAENGAAPPIPPKLHGLPNQCGRSSEQGNPV